MTITVLDPEGAASDEAMPSLAEALDPERAQKELPPRLARILREGDEVTVTRIEAVRYKPGRRCLIQYDLDVCSATGEIRREQLLGKVRVKRFGKSGYRTLELLWTAGFDSRSSDGICVPEPVGTVSAFRMWLQRKVPGAPLTDYMSSVRAEELCQGAARAAHKIHTSPIEPEKRHTMSDELAILRAHLPGVAESMPHLNERVESVMAACELIAKTVPELGEVPSHRDFYPDQILYDRGRFVVIDFDLLCFADPGLDIGNFIGHLTEQALRDTGDPVAYSAAEQSAEENFVRLAGEAVRPSVRVYALLTLVRHVYLSRRIAGRGHLTSALLELCERKLDARAN